MAIKKTEKISRAIEIQALKFGQNYYTHRVQHPRKHVGLCGSFVKKTKNYFQKFDFLIRVSRHCSVRALSCVSRPGLHKCI